MAQIGCSAGLVAMYIETVRIGNNCVGAGVVVLVGFDVLLDNGGGKGLEHLKGLRSNIEVGLEGPFETAERRVREPTDDSLVVDVSADGVGGYIFVVETEPTDEGPIYVEACEVAETFDTSGGGVLKFINGVAGD